MPLIINDEKIDNALIAQEIESVRAQQREDPEEFAFDSQEELVEYARENVICRVLLQQEATRQIDAVAADEVEAAFGELVAEHGGEEAFYEAHGIDASHDAEIKSNLETNLKVQRLMDRLCEDVAEPGEEEVRAYYEAHSEELVHPEEVHASHMVKRPAGPADAEATFAEMREVRRKLLGGEEFAELAAKHSDCADNGGDLGFFAPGQMVESFEAVVFSMEAGEVSPVFLTEFGYHVAKVHERRPQRPCSFEEVRDEIRERLFYDRKNDRIGRYVEEVKQRSTIVELPEEEQERAEADEQAGAVEDVPAEDESAADREGDAQSG